MDADKKQDVYTEHAEDPKHNVNVNNFAQNVNAKSVISEETIRLAVGVSETDHA